jgi:hypothetical protein
MLARECISIPLEGTNQTLAGVLHERIAAKPEADDKPLDMAMIVGGVNVRTANIATLSIGDLVIRNQTFFVLDIRRGQTFRKCSSAGEMLQSFAVRIEFAKNQVSFIDLAKLSYSGRGTSVPLALNKHGKRHLFRFEGRRYRRAVPTEIR